MGADLATIRFLNTPLVPTANGHVKDRLVSGEGQPIRVLTFVRSQVKPSVRGDAAVTLILTE